MSKEVLKNLLSGKLNKRSLLLSREHNLKMAGISYEHEGKMIYKHCGKEISKELFDSLPVLKINLEWV